MHLSCFLDWKHIISECWHHGRATFDVLSVKGLLNIQRLLVCSLQPPCIPHTPLREPTCGLFPVYHLMLHLTLLIHLICIFLFACQKQIKRGGLFFKYFTRIGSAQLLSEMHVYQLREAFLRLSGLMSILSHRFQPVFGELPVNLFRITFVVNTLKNFDSSTESSRDPGKAGPVTVTEITAERRGLG